MELLIPEGIKILKTSVKISLTSIFAGTIMVCTVAITTGVTVGEEL